DMEEEMGVKNFEVTFDAKINFSCSGLKYKNALRGYGPTIVTSGFKGVFAFLNTSMTEYGTEIYCQKGSKPDFSVKLTYDMNGGELDGKTVVTLMSDSDGKIVLPEGKPERESCEFLYYRVDKGYQVVNTSMRFDCDTTIKAQYKGLFKVTFDANSTEYEVSEDTKQFTIDEYSTCPIPKLVKKSTAPKTRFKGWYIGDKQVFPGKTEIESHSVITAQWYSQKEVNDYMADLGNKEADYLYVHVAYQNIDRSQTTFWGPNCFADRINADGSRGEYTDVCDYGQIDIAGYEFKMDLNHHTMYQNGVSLKLFDCDILIRLSYIGGKYHEFVIPKNKIKKGKPNHVFYNADTKEVSYNW
ncbi:MAG: hypothetical protein K2L88_00185, partial [Clostridiales bacterium]|nr:hypothetical protein [Clostridiales bacterium]